MQAMFGAGFVCVAGCCPASEVCHGGEGDLLNSDADRPVVVGLLQILLLFRECLATDFCRKVCWLGLPFSSFFYSLVYTKEGLLKRFAHFEREAGTF